MRLKKGGTTLVHRMYDTKCTKEKGKKKRKQKGQT